MKIFKLKSINAKILLTILCAMFLMGAITLYVINLSLKQSLYDRVHEQVSDNAHTGLNLIEKTYPGDWKLDGDKLYKGSKLINGDTQIVDSIDKAIGVPVTIFAKDIRIATNIIENGNRIIGTKAPDNVIDEVLNKGNDYIGGVRVKGVDYEGIYISIKDSSNNVIGMFFVGEESKFIEQSLTSQMLKITIIIFIIFAISLILVTIIIRRIVRNIKKVVSSMVSIGNGDFTVRSDIRTGDEIELLSKSQNDMAEKLGNLVSNIKQIATSLSSSANLLASASEENTATTEEISKSINEIANATSNQAQETEAGLDKTSNLAKDINQISTAINTMTAKFSDATNLYSKGIDTVKILSEKTDQSNDASTIVSNAITEMFNRSKDITSIMDTIQEIASQTNLLSLNASIEAARAGENGRGFSVVADEIRKLADQSSNAVNKINQIIKNIQSESQNAVNQMTATKGFIIEQNKAVKETQNIFIEISGAVTSLSDQVNKISESNKEMVAKKDTILSVMEEISASADQTSAASEQISASTQEQLASIEEVSNAAEKLNVLATQLNSEIEKFKI